MHAFLLNICCAYIYNIYKIIALIITEVTKLKIWLQIPQAVYSLLPVFEQM
jgi:hypothetical protein